MNTINIERYISEWFGSLIIRKDAFALSGLSFSKDIINNRGNLFNNRKIYLFRKFKHKKPLEQ